MRKLPKVLATAGAGALLAVGGFASATFLLTSTGNASGEVASPHNPTVTGHTIDRLWPGYCNDVSVTFTNDNDVAVKILSVDGDVDPLYGKVDSGHGSDQHNLLMWAGYTTGNFSSLGHIVGAGESYDITVPDAVCLDDKAANDVEGKDVKTHITIKSEVVAGNEFARARPAG